MIGSAFTAPGSVSNVTLLDNSTWIMTGSSNVTNLVNDPSLIQFTPPTGDPTLLASYKTLTTVNYIGIDGVIGLNTFLGLILRRPTAWSSTAATPAASRRCASPTPSAAAR